MQRRAGSGTDGVGQGGRRAAVMVGAAACLCLLSAVVPSAAQAAGPGSATAQAADVKIAANAAGVPVLAGLLSTIALSASTPQQSAPAAPGTANSTTGLKAGAAGAASVGTGAVTATATRTTTSTSGSSTVDSATVGVLGSAVLTSGVISSAATCPVGGAPTATVSVANVQVGGATVAAGGSAQVPVTATGVAGANVLVSVSSPHTTTTTTATSTGLLVDLTLRGTLIGTTTAVSVPLGQVTFAASTCATPAAATATAPVLRGITPATGPTAGGQRVTLTGSGFTPGTAVTFGGVPGTAVTVVSPTTLSVTTPAHAAGPVAVVATSAAGASGPLGYTFVPPSVTSITPDRGPAAGGQTVTISGTGFGPGEAVSIGGHPATGVRVNPAGTQLIATTPAGAVGPADVVVTGAGQSQARLPGGYTYLPAPTANGLSPDRGPAGGGQSVTITGSGFVPGATTVTFGGSSATMVTVLSPNRLRAVTPTGTGGVQVEVRTSGGTGTAAGGYTYLAAAGTDNGVVAGPGQLPYTGLDAVRLAAVGSWLLVGGLWLLVAGGRRRRAAGR